VATSDVTADKVLVAGDWRDPEGQLTIVSPSTEEPAGVVGVAGFRAAAEAVAAARTAFDEGPWPRMTLAERGRHLRRIRDGFASRQDDIVEAVTTEIGVPIGMSRGMMARALLLWDDHLEMASTVSLDERRSFATGSGRVVREPVGVVLGFPSWNGPAYNVSLKSAPPLLAGCPVVLKTVPEVGLSTRIFAEIFRDADLPQGVVSLLPAEPEVSEWLVAHPAVDKVSFTGSTSVGRRIMALCAERIGRVTLELGGKSAAIVLDDLDPRDPLARTVVNGVQNSGQVCSANTRIVLPRQRYDDWLEALSDVLSSLRVGDPFDPATDIGPLAHARHLERVERYLSIARDEGARVMCGGGRPPGLRRGYFVEPTLLDGTNDMTVAREEIFGPVLVAMPHDGVDDAVATANDSPYGLAGSVFSNDPAAAEAVALRLRAGVIRINDGVSHPALPFGGYKSSGLGREGGTSGLDGYLETKAIAQPPTLSL
jgi:acyl-CoA reductase-like NAD-dependent aldehyde dehydrogenase